MADTDIILRFVYPTSSNSDLRTFTVYQIIEGEDDPSELYRVSRYCRPLQFFCG